MQESVSFASKALPPMLTLLLLHAVVSTFAATSAAAGCGGNVFGAGIISPPRVATPTVPSRSAPRGSSGISGPWGASGISGPWGASGSDGGRGGNDGGRGGSGANAGNDNGGNSRSSGTSCTWNLVAAGGKFVDIHFTAMQLLKNHDSLSIYSGNLLVATFTGSSLPPNMTLGSTARLVFTSDDAIKTRTFTVVFMSRALLCGGLLVVNDRTNSSVITSPGHPRVYPNNADCTWTIVSPTTGKTRLMFTFVELDDRKRDRLIVYDGSDLAMRCADAMAPEQRNFNLGRTVVIRFTSNAYVQKRGFRAEIVGQSSPHGGTGSWRS